VPLTKYVSIDVETTGLDPSRHQILELAMVVETDWQTSPESLPTLHYIVQHDELTGTPTALAMNAELVRQLTERPTLRRAPTSGSHDLARTVREFLIANFGDPARSGKRVVTAAGKNLAFDLGFLGRLPHWPAELFRHRVIDAGNLWWEPARDDKLPDTALCLSRAGLLPVRAHDALEDSRAVVKLVRRWYAHRERFATVSAAA
jgi:oligoribonuclease (3'-5' exoribonuclease)